MEWIIQTEIYCEKNKYSVNLVIGTFLFINNQASLGQMSPNHSHYYKLK